MALKQKWDHGTDTTGRFRGGKTKHERANGSAQHRFARQQARADWQKDNRATNATFPV